MPSKAVSENWPDLAIGIDPGSIYTGVAVNTGSGAVVSWTVDMRREDQIAILEGIKCRFGWQVSWQILVAIESPGKDFVGGISQQLISMTEVRQLTSDWRMTAETAFPGCVLLFIRPADRHPAITANRIYSDDHVRDAEAVLKVALDEFMYGRPLPRKERYGRRRLYKRRDQNRRPYSRRVKDEDDQ